jgi:hypothetical protein
VYLPLGERAVPSSRRFRQALWTDAVYVRHLFELDRLDGRELAMLFVILHVSYGATDLCARVLEHLDAKNGTAAVKRYRSEALEVSRASTGRLRQATT